MDISLVQAKKLKDALVDFVYDAEGDLAVALETYAAEHSSREQHDSTLQNILIDSFALEGKVGTKTAIDLFSESEPDLTASDRTLLKSWNRSFMGLFELLEMLPEQLEVMNWLTAKTYSICLDSQSQSLEIQRLKPGEIILARIAPLNENNWMFFSPIILKGKLGKPKLAVAIGEFKNHYKHHLYSDAPELLELSWESVATYHQDFVDFLGSDQISLPGYKLNQKIAELSEKISQNRLKQAGIDPSKSLEELAKEAGADESELQAAMVEAGGDEQEVMKALKSKTLMVTPKVELPDEIKKAEEVTAFSHPRWGLLFVPYWEKYTNLLTSDDPQILAEVENWVRKLLKDPKMNFWIWEQLKTQDPKALEKILKTVVENPNFSIDQDWETTLLNYGKPSEPELPEIASVPKHLDDLFQEAIAQVQKTKSKGKTTTKKTKGFQS